MIKTASLIILSVLAVSTPALADDDWGGRGQHMMHPGMGLMMMDQNEDQTISREEFDAHFADKFKAADADGDGKVSKDEFAAFAEAERERRRQMMRDRMFSYVDTNGDGVISEAESKANGDKMFERMDRNSDGKLDRNDRMAREGHHMGPRDGMGEGMGPDDGGGMMKPEN